METAITIIAVIALDFMALIIAFALFIGLSVLWKHCVQPNNHEPEDLRKGCDGDEVFWG